ncbi:hypothetical protein [Staphylococcus arlettae]|uniref:hypothetical protein n=1 Tax=Staphylococcus arlettae TaxID=29378 RepID=UPI001E3984C5|nr:hypothetical protein [Staphylococcus arlettae]MCD8866748.1 hypothetical protein [Staphylococcus arlettae]
MAVGECIENALQIKLFTILVILAGVGRRNHFFKIRFLSHSIFYSKPLFIWAVADCIENALQTKLFTILVILAGVGQRNLFSKSDFCPTPFATTGHH